ncbi:MAG: histidinol-phosphatase, partial [Gammaproteobacteria bacterium]|nr:histidinol-phosphatase [Gammaproteobacteria bacterium]
LIVFGDQWLENGQDHINPFLGVAFEGKIPDQYETENGRSSLGLLEIIRKLEGYHKEFFMIFAHVEDRSGLWHELGGGRLQEMGRNEIFTRRSLGFQKVRAHDVPDRTCRVKVQSWLGDWYPAEVEGSDCKSIEEIGKGRACYLKIGDFSFEAVKYALSDHENRVSATQPEHHKHSHILSVSFDGGMLDGQTIRLSSELNTLIGIRGSGKSSILEAIRYALDIPFGEKALDTGYKTNLVDHVLGSGGKVTVWAMDQWGQHYDIRRINREGPDVYIDGVLQPGISIRETIVHKPLYFGQKDLSATGEGFEKDLVEKLVGEKLAGIRVEIDAQRQRISDLTDRWQKLSNTAEKKKEYENKKRDAEYRLSLFKRYGVEEKLQRQVDFDTDAKRCSQVVDFARSYLAELDEFINRYEGDLRNRRVYTSRQNQDFFDSFFALYDELIAAFDRIKQALADGNRVLTGLREKAGEFTQRKDTLKEEFDGVERRLSEQLRQSGAPAIRPDEFRQIKKTVDQAAQMLEALDKQATNREGLRQELVREITRLNDLWHEEFKAILAELDNVNQGQSSLAIKAEFKGDTAAFVAFIKDVFRGSGIRGTTFSSLAEAFPDAGAMFKAGFREVKEKIGVSEQTVPVFTDYFLKNLPALLTWQVPNRFTIEYRGKELKHHSLGQRASALILFVLSQRENDVFIIDQPEDDLDNQTIYEDVIKLIRKIKPETQFLFATHNANFPVLGDAEQIISCAYADDRVEVTSGSIDHPELQQEIVDIMEGGEEAFRQRKMRYESWKP